MKSCVFSSKIRDVQTKGCIVSFGNPLDVVSNHWVNDFAGKHVVFVHLSKQYVRPLTNTAVALMDRKHWTHSSQTALVARTEIIASAEDGQFIKTVIFTTRIACQPELFVLRRVALVLTSLS